MPMMGTAPSEIGESWFAVELTASLPPLLASQAQPLPNLFIAASEKRALSASREPNSAVIAAASAPVGAPPPAGERRDHQSVWLTWPPTLLRSVVRSGSSKEDRPARISSPVFDRSSGWPSRALFAFLM